MTQAYPLQWPDHLPRTPEHKREYSRFDVTQKIAQAHLLKEVNLLGGKNAVLSTNIALRQDGLPYASRRPPTDTGVAIYFTYKGAARSFACDRYLRIWENMRALGKTIEAMRGISRWGAHEVLDQMFQGFTSLPPPDAMTPAPPMRASWWQVLNVKEAATLKECNAAYHTLARVADDAGLYAINEAIAIARKIKKENI